MSPHPLFVAAAASYAANCALGASVGLRIIDTRRFRWVHHALYIATSTLAATAAGTAAIRGREGDRRAAAALAPAAVPLAVINRISAHSRTHVVVALAAAPFFAAGVILSRK